MLLEEEIYFSRLVSPCEEATQGTIQPVGSAFGLMGRGQQYPTWIPFCRYLCFGSRNMSKKNYSAWAFQSKVFCYSSPTKQMCRGLSIYTHNCSLWLVTFHDGNPDIFKHKGIQVYLKSYSVLHLNCVWKRIKRTHRLVSHFFARCFPYLLPDNEMIKVLKVLLVGYQEKSILLCVSKGKGMQGRWGIKHKWIE